MSIAAPYVLPGTLNSIARIGTRMTGKARTIALLHIAITADNIRDGDFSKRTLRKFINALDQRQVYKALKRYEPKHKQREARDVINTLTRIAKQTENWHAVREVAYLANNPWGGHPKKRGEHPLYTVMESLERMSDKGRKYGPIIERAAKALNQDEVFEVVKYKDRDFLLKLVGLSRHKDGAIKVKIAAENYLKQAA